jgi:hypothetical protein
MFGLVMCLILDPILYFIYDSSLYTIAFVDLIFLMSLIWVLLDKTHGKYMLEKFEHELKIV